MKYLYVLVSSVQDTYYEQFLLSVTSLRLKNPDAHITVLCDSKTKENLQGKRREYENIVSEIKTVPVQDTLSQKEVSRHIKTSMRRYIDGDFLFIDCDTIITDTISESSFASMDIGAVLDTHCTVDFHHLKPYIIANDEKLGFGASKTNKHYNSGIIFCRDTVKAHGFFDKWHDLWTYGNEKNITIDQPSFNEAILQYNDVFADLNGIWNCQISHNGLPFLHDAKIIHYYGSKISFVIAPFLPASPSVLSSVKETGTISAETMGLLENPKAAFGKYSRIIADRAAIDAFDSYFFSILRWLWVKNPSLFKNLDKFMHYLIRPIKKLIENHARLSVMNG
ncbi:hypothetical protein FACS189479_07350 [Spirochaetia bacterium]|nr:hypothetical protein FACS189479_07350 [Spirochaetia bacterium]